MLGWVAYICVWPWISRGFQRQAMSDTAHACMHTHTHLIIYYKYYVWKMLRSSRLLTLFDSAWIPLVKFWFLSEIFWAD